MIKKKELTDRFSTIEINSNEIELMTSHTVYEKNEDKKDLLYPDYSGTSTRGYLGTVTFDKKNKKCYHSYLSIIDGKNVVTYGRYDDKTENEPLVGFVITSDRKNYGDDW